MDETVRELLTALDVRMKVEVTHNIYIYMSTGPRADRGIAADDLGHGR